MTEAKSTIEPKEVQQIAEQDHEESQDSQKACQLFWDYYGPSARGTAEHFLKHLHTWLSEQGYTAFSELKVLSFSDQHSAASCVLPFDEGKIVFKALKAHRAYHYEPNKP